MTTNPIVEGELSSAVSDNNNESRTIGESPKAEESSLSESLLFPLKECGRCLYSRVTYTPLARRYFKELVYQSIPVFLAASFSSFVMSLIRYISEEGEGDHIDNECIQSIVYAIISYIIGYFLSIQLKQAIESKEKSNFINMLENAEFTEIIFSTLAECTGFAWREFINIFLLKILYLRYGWGPALGGWFLILFVFIIISLVSGKMMQSLSFPTSHKELLIEYNSDSFALSLSFSITVIWALACELIGAEYVDKTGYLYEWKDDDYEEESSGVNGYYYIYIFIISVVVALILVFEDRYCFQWFRQAEERIDAHRPRLDNPPDSSTEIIVSSLKNSSSDSVEVVVELWHSFLGCLVGVAYYALILDEFLAYGDDSDVGLVIVSFIIAFIISWRGPSCIASSVQRQEEAQRQWQERRQRNEDTNEEKKSVYSSLCDWYLHLSFHRRGTSIISISLIIGWTWETFIFELLNLISDASSLDNGSLVAVDFSIFILAVVIAFIVQRMVRNLNIESIEGASGTTLGAFQTNTPDQTIAIEAQVMNR